MHKKGIGRSDLRAAVNNKPVTYSRALFHFYIHTNLFVSPFLTVSLAPNHCLIITRSIRRWMANDLNLCKIHLYFFHQSNRYRDASFCAWLFLHLTKIYIQHNRVQSKQFCFFFLLRSVLRAVSVRVERGCTFGVTSKAKYLRIK